MYRKQRIISGLILLVVSLTMLIWGEWKFPKSIISTSFRNYQITLEFPSNVRLGDLEYIKLSINKNISTEQKVNSPDDINEEQDWMEAIPDESSYNMLAEGRLELKELPFAPTGEIIEHLQPDHPLTFYWKIRPDKTGFYQGLVWLHFQYVSKEDGEIIRKIISSQPIKISAISLLGLGGDYARVFGGVGIFISLILNYDLFTIKSIKLFKNKGKTNA